MLDDTGGTENSFGSSSFATPYPAAAERGYSGDLDRIRSGATTFTHSENGPPSHNLAAIAGAFANEIEIVPEPPEEQDGVYLGMKVRHGKFGVGTVRKVEGEGEGQKVVVWFNSVGPKKLMLRFAGLERA